MAIIIGRKPRWTDKDRCQLCGIKAGDEYLTEALIEGLCPDCHRFASRLPTACAFSWTSSNSSST